MKIPGSIYIDSPSFPLLQAVISYQSVATANGNVLGTSIVDAGLAFEPSYQALVVKILSENAAGQVRPVATHVGNTITVAAAFTDAAGAVVQIVAGTLFVILSIGAGGGGGPPPVSPGIGLWMFGVVDPAQVASTTVLTLTNLAGFPNDIFKNEFWIQVIHNASAPNAAPEREVRRITDYVGATGTFTCDAFSVNVEANDLVAIFHESIMGIEIIAFGTLDTDSATVPADSTRAAAHAWENDNYFRGCLLMLTEGNCRFQPRRIVQYTNAGGIFTLDPNNPLSQAPGLVDYVAIRDQAEFVPVAGGANNRTPSDVIGIKTELIPAMNLAPGDDAIVSHIKAILERLGATPADPDDSLLTNVGQRDDAATADSMADITTTSIEAKIRLILNRLSPNAFTADVQGAARTELDTMLAQLAVYFRAAGAALSVTMNPGAGARADLQLILQDLADMLAGATGIVTFPAGAAPANGVSMAEVIRQIYNDLVTIVADDGLTTFSQLTAAATDANGLAWVDLYDGSAIANTTEICGIKLTVSAGWAGNASFRIVTGAGVKIFPFQAEYVQGTDFTSGVQLVFNFVVKVRPANGLKVQFRSSNAGDGAGKTVAMNNLDIITRT